MIGAIVRDNLVENLIVIDEEQVPEMEGALDCEIVDARPYGLAVGDLRTAAGWTRNADGEQMVLRPLEQKQYDGYTLAVQRAEAAEAAAQHASEEAAEETLGILTGAYGEVEA